jgi:hypothetical protein
MNEYDQLTDILLDLVEDHGRVDDALIAKIIRVAAPLSPRNVVMELSRADILKELAEMFAIPSIVNDDSSLVVEFGISDMLAIWTVAERLAARRVVVEMFHSTIIAVSADGPTQVQVVSTKRGTAPMPTNAEIVSQARLSAILERYSE